jgi:hypothetical protein
MKIFGLKHRNLMRISSWFDLLVKGSSDSQLYKYGIKEQDRDHLTRMVCEG